MSSWLAQLDLQFTQAASGPTVLTRKHHQGPLLVQKALYPEDRGICHLMILHPPAGIAGGDQLQIQAHLQEQAHAVLSTPGATRWYKAPEQRSEQTIQFHLAAQAKLDWLPYENIFFEQTQALNKTQVYLDPDSSAIGWDMSQLGAVHLPEPWQTGHVSLQTELFIGSELAWVEQGQIQADSWQRQAISAFAGYPVTATLWAYGPTLEREQFQALCDTAPWQEQCRAGFTQIRIDPIHSLIIGRYLGIHCEQIRRSMIQAWRILRPLIHQTPYQALRIWMT